MKNPHNVLAQLFITQCCAIVHHCSRQRDFVIAGQFVTFPIIFLHLGMKCHWWHSFLQCKLYFAQCHHLLHSFGTIYPHCKLHLHTLEIPHYVRWWPQVQKLHTASVISRCPEMSATIDTAQNPRYCHFRSCNHIVSDNNYQSLFLKWNDHVISGFKWMWNDIGRS